MEEATNIKLTPKQNCVVWCLQNGWVLVTDNQTTGALVCSSSHEYRINNGLFFRLVNMGIIHQRDSEHRYDYHLTHYGHNLVTKPCGLLPDNKNIIERLRSERKHETTT